MCSCFNFRFIKMNILNLPHLSVVPGDLLKRVERVWISGKKCAIITKSDEVYTIDSADSSNPPEYIPELCGKKVTDIIFGGDFIIALNVNGQIYSWGRNDYGQLGLGHETAIYTPTMISFLSEERVVKVDCSKSSVIALCEKGEVFYWGYSGYSTTSSTPTKCNDMSSGIRIACCSNSKSLKSYRLDDGVLRNDNKNVCIFFNIKGENKLRFPGGYIQFEKKIEKVVCGISHVLVLDSEGKIQILYGGTTFTQLDISEKIIDIAASPISSFSAAMAENKTIFVWNSRETKPYPTTFVTFQEAFLTLSQPVTSYGVVYLKSANLAKSLNTDLMESIIKTFDEPEHSDITVLIDEKKIHVHKVILDARSNYFRTMFREQWQENKDNELKVKDYSYEVFKNYLKYLYGMEIEITSENVIDLMRIADQYMDDTLEHLITKKVESDTTISRPIKLLKEIMRLPASEYEVLCKGLSTLVFSKDSSSTS